MKRIYLLGIGGIAMANLACILKEQSYSVSGSDMDTFGPSAELLKKYKIHYYKNHNPTHIKIFKPDIVIISNAMARGNPILEYVLNEQIPYCSMPDAIRDELIKNKKSIVVTGTSGKTTTTAITAWILETAGLKPTVLVGGIMKNTNNGFMSGNGDYVVIEGDESNSSFYDSSPKFTHYRPYHAIITNIHPDHLDIFDNIENIFKAFQKLVKLIPSSGSLVLNNVNSYSTQLSEESPANTITFGNNGNIEARKINYAPEGVSFEVWHNQKKLGEIKSRLFGKHNVENTLAAIAVSLNTKIPFSKISRALAEFQGVKRRLEVIYQNDTLTIIDDFAHNPEKVSASLSAIRSHFPKHQIIAIFEPRTSSSRRKFFQDVYISSFRLADLVYISEPYKKNVLNKKELFSSSRLVKDLNKQGIKSYALENADEIIAHVKKESSKTSGQPAIIIVMTNGEFEGIHHKLISLFK